MTSTTRDRAEQKRQEITSILAKLPATEEGFVEHSGWYRNKKGNLVCLTLLTIFPQHSHFNWVVAGGKTSFGPGGFATEEEAVRNLWRFLSGYGT